MYELQPATERLIQDTNRFRDDQEAICADPEATLRPEDAASALRLRKGAFQFDGSIVEVGLLDRNGQTIRNTVAALARGDDPDIWLPTDRRQFSYIHDMPMPSLTLSGTFRPDTGISNLDLRRTRVLPRRYTYESNRIQYDPLFAPIAAFAHALKKHDLNQSCRNPKRSRLQPSVAVAAFSNTINLGVAQLTREARLPQLLHAYPAVIVLEDGSEFTDVLVTPEPHGHALFQDREYGSATSPARALRDWFNQVALTHFMDTGNSILSYEEANILADWFNYRKRMRLNRIAHKAVNSSSIKAA